METDGNDAWAALDRLENGEKWTKGAPYWNGKRCLIGAICNSQEIGLTNIYADVAEHPLTPSVLDTIREQFPERYAQCAHDGGVAGTLYRFNDHMATTYDDIRIVLEKVAVASDEILS